MGRKKKPEKRVVTGHNPGPWKAVYCPLSEQHFVEVRHSGYKTLIARVSNHTEEHPGGPEFEGLPARNASLISAAPEMFDALRLLLKAYDLKTFTPVSNFAPLWADAQRAMRKAEGKPLIHGTQGRE